MLYRTMVSKRCSHTEQEGMAMVGTSTTSLTVATNRLKRNRQGWIETSKGDIVAMRGFKVGRQVANMTGVELV